MMGGSARRGSALLIVLGVIMFIVASGVAFAVYMRHQRLPSSYLRNVTALRQLAKVGLSRAIDEIETVLLRNGDEPFPGLHGQDWQGRVMVPNGEVSFGATATPLTFESLAHVPPPLINEVRLLSRQTSTARWMNIEPFDSGRYVYSVLNVSDYLDVNRMTADYPRSSMPARRVSMSYLFETEDHSDSGDTETWENFMDKYRTIDEETGLVSYDEGSKVPFVSLADFNLALYKEGKAKGVGGPSEAGTFFSPFCNYMSSNGGSGFYGFDLMDERASAVQRMTFITDSWFPAPQDGTTGVDDDLDLADVRNQPFTMDFLSRNPPITSAIMQPTENKKAVDLWGRQIPRIVFPALYDYLDPDMVPCSLSVPTTERVAMVCGLQPMPNTGNDKFKLAKYRNGSPEAEKAPDKSLPAEGNARKWQRVESFKFDGFQDALGGVRVRSLLTYPFRHDDGIKNTTFVVDGAIAFYLSDAAANQGVPLRVMARDTPLQFLKIEGDKNAKALANAIIVPLVPEGGDEIEMSPKKNKDQITDEARADEQRAVREIVLRPPNSQARGVIGSKEYTVLEITYEWTEQSDGNGGFVSREPTAADITEVTSKFQPMNYEGLSSEVFREENKESLLGKIKNGDSISFKMEAAVWARVKYKGPLGEDPETTVDLVPASVVDDDEFLPKTRNYDGSSSQLRALGFPYPLIKFGIGNNTTFTVGYGAEETPEQNLTFSPNAAIVADPRFNHAPENWFGITVNDSTGGTGKNIFRDAWLQSNEARGRDGDIFMATSDQGYLQSVYELGFLPRLSDIPTQEDPHNRKFNDAIFGDSGYKQYTDSFDLTLPQNFAATRDANFAWNTYRVYGPNSDFLDDLGFKNPSGGFRVNPYSDSTNVLMSVFANTPVDWRMASTNNMELTEDILNMSAAKFNKKYAYNEFSDDTKIAWIDLEDIAGAFSAAARRAPYDWESAWDNLNWKGDRTHLCGVELDSTTEFLSSADRKFLYGFWRDCFAVRQQLFLVFFRVTPEMWSNETITDENGAIRGGVPPPYGGRGVALVWRDPYAPENPSSPTNRHRTRVLYYRYID